MGHPWSVPSNKLQLTKHTKSNQSFFSLPIVIIIYHDFLPPPWRCSHVKSDNTQTIINIHPLAHILDICTLIFSSCDLFYGLSQPHHVTASHPSPGDTHQNKEGGPKEHWAKQKWQRSTHSVTYVPGLSTRSDLSRIDVQPPQSFLCCPRPPSHHPSRLTSVSFVPASTYFRHQHRSGHTILIHSFHMPK